MLLELTQGLVDDGTFAPPVSPYFYQHNQEESMSVKSYSIDRTNEIRSSTGYEG